MPVPSSSARGSGCGGAPAKASAGSANVGGVPDRLLQGFPTGADDLAIVFVWGLLSARMVTPRELQAQTDELVWFHTIDLGNGVVTKGLGLHWYGPEVFPTFSGRSVLDIGAWDGYYSFLAEQNGASRVVAMDHYAWGVDMGMRDAYWRECLRVRCRAGSHARPEGLLELRYARPARVQLCASGTRVSRRARTGRFHDH